MANIFLQSKAVCLFSDRTHQTHKHLRALPEAGAKGTAQSVTHAHAALMMKANNPEYKQE
jgi:hypothetical protein